MLFLVWIIAGASSTHCGSTDNPQACQAGTAIGVGAIIVLAAAVNAVLGVLWLVTRKRGRECPVCGKTVRRGEVVCRSCGYDYRPAPSV
ncbi:MAG: hypothetical protein ABR511_11190 [Acidimicrobiales bacterium]